MLKYISTIKEIHCLIGLDAFLFYDESFRKLRKEHQQPWQVVIDIFIGKLSISGFLRYNTIKSSFSIIMANDITSTFFNKDMVHAIYTTSIKAENCRKFILFFFSKNSHVLYSGSWKLNTRQQACLI